MFEAWVMEIRNPVTDIMAWKKTPKVGDTGKIKTFDGETFPAKCVKAGAGLYDVVILTSIITDKVIIEAKNTTTAQPPLFT